MEKDEETTMKLLLVIAKLSVYSVLTYLAMLVISVLRFPKSENNQLLVGEENPNHPKFLKTPIVKTNLTIVKVNVTVSNNVNLSCLKENASLIVVVKSKIDNFERRKNIRESWGGNLQCIFFLIGQGSSILEERAGKEMAQWKDVLQYPGEDSYRLLTNKALWLLRLLNQEAGSTFILLYVDDDVLINPWLLSGLTPNSLCARLSPLPLVLGSTYHSPKVERSGKNAVTFAEWPHEEYPNFAAGLAYFLTREAVIRLSIAASYVSFLWLDDVFLTGVLAAKADLLVVDIQELYDYQQQHAVASQDGRVSDLLGDQKEGDSSGGGKEKSG